MSKVARIEAQIEALEAERLRLLTQPEDIYQDGDVVWFTKRFGGEWTRYTYAAVKISTYWYITGSTEQRRPSPRSWEALLDFVGDGELWAATEWEQIQ